MNEELKLHLKKLQRQATIIAIVLLLFFFSLGLGILFALSKSLVSIIYFAIAILSILFLVYNSRTIKKESKENHYEPVIFNADNNFTFEEIASIFENLTDKSNQLSISEDVRFYLFFKIFRLRTILYRTTEFKKRTYNNEKARINRKANKEFHLTSSSSLFDANTKMRFNIIYADSLNDMLYQYISQNTRVNLSRVEGIINIAIVGNQIMIPPLYGECAFTEINKYKKVIEFINQVFLNK